MNRRAEANAEQDVRPDLADDFLDVRPAGLETLDPADGLIGMHDALPGLDFLHPVFKKTLHFELADDEAGNDGDQ